MVPSVRKGLIIIVSSGAGFALVGTVRAARGTGRLWGTTIIPPESVENHNK